jgi:hypothetical protein
MQGILSGGFFRRTYRPEDCVLTFKWSFTTWNFDEIYWISYCCCCTLETLSVDKLGRFSDWRYCFYVARQRLMQTRCWVISSNSTRSICCGLVVQQIHAQQIERVKFQLKALQQVVQQIHNLRQVLQLVVQQIHKNGTRSIIAWMKAQ